MSQCFTHWTRVRAPMSFDIHMTGNILFRLWLHHPAALMAWKFVRLSLLGFMLSITSWHSGPRHAQHLCRTIYDNTLWPKLCRRHFQMRFSEYKRGIEQATNHYLNHWWSDWLKHKWATWLRSVNSDRCYWMIRWMHIIPLVFLMHGFSSNSVF